MSRTRVSILCATYNARAAVQLTLRTLDRYTSEPKHVFVADNGSTDGTLRYLRSLAWLRVTALRERRLTDPAVLPEHGATLDWLAGHVDTPFFLTLDSDVEFRADGWLAEMLDLAEADDLAALGVYEPGLRAYRPRLAPFALLLRTSAFRALDVSFRSFVRIEDPAEAARWQARKARENLDVDELDSYRTAAVYPTGAAVFERLQSTGLRWAGLPESIAGKLVHLGHMSWGGTEAGRLRARHRQLRADVRLRLAALG